MTATLLALLFAADAGPALRVRVLERDHPRELWLSSQAIGCDGASLPDAEVRALADPRGVAVGARRCRSVTARDARVRWGGRARSFRGTLRLEARKSELVIVNEVGEEDYLRGVLSSELAPGAPQAMRAQAVVSRSFARAGRGRHGKDHDLCDLAHCQVYLGREGETAESDAALAATAGLVLRDAQGAVLPGYFHSCCGGATSAPEDVFGEATGLRGVGDVGPDGPACAACPSASWTFSADRGELAQALGVAASGPALEISRRDGGGRVLQVRAFGRLYRGDLFASKVGRRFGWQALRSLRWESVSEQGGKVRVRGRGLGHGVGLCQWGARGLSARGLDWRAILQHYFPEATVGE